MLVEEGVELVDEFNVVVEERVELVEVCEDVEDEGVEVCEDPVEELTVRDEIKEIVPAELVAPPVEELLPLKDGGGVVDEGEEVCEDPVDELTVGDEIEVPFEEEPPPAKELLPLKDGEDVVVVAAVEPRPEVFEEPMEVVPVATVPVVLAPVMLAPILLVPEIPDVDDKVVIDTEEGDVDDAPLPPDPKLTHKRPWQPDVADCEGTLVLLDVLSELMLAVIELAAELLVPDAADCEATLTLLDVLSELMLAVIEFVAELLKLEVGLWV